MRSSFSVSAQTSNTHSLSQRLGKDTPKHRVTRDSRDSHRVFLPTGVVSSQDLNVDGNFFSHLVHLLPIDTVGRLVTTSSSSLFVLLPVVHTYTLWMRQRCFTHTPTRIHTRPTCISFKLFCFTFGAFYTCSTKVCLCGWLPLLSHISVSTLVTVYKNTVRIRLLSIKYCSYFWILWK